MSSTNLRYFEIFLKRREDGKAHGHAADNGPKSDCGPHLIIVQNLFHCSGSPFYVSIGIIA
jgi:hypothetical protein